MLELEYHVIQLTNTDVTAVTVALWGKTRRLSDLLQGIQQEAAGAALESNGTKTADRVRRRCDPSVALATGSLNSTRIYPILCLQFV
jgi:hypothetical protein